MSEENNENNEENQNSETGDQSSDTNSNKTFTQEELDAEVTGLKNTVAATRKERDEMKAQYSELANSLEEMKKQFGDVDIEEYKAMQERKASERENAAKTGNEEAFLEFKAAAEKQQAEKEAEFRRLIQEREEMIEQKDKLLQVELVDSAVKSALIKAGGNDKTVELASHIVKRNLKSVVNEETGRLELHIIGDSGERRWTADGNDPVPLTVEAYALEVRDAYPEAFPGSMASGMGAGGGTLTKAGRFDALERKKVDTWSPEEKDDYIQNRGQDAYKKCLRRDLGLVG